MSQTMRVLQVVTTMNRGGLETMLMNYYRHMDRERLQFDFVEHRQEWADYDDEIARLGGKIYRMPTLVPWSRNYRRAWQDFFVAHPEYQVIHVHQDCLSGVILQEARRAGVAVRIAHSHSASQDKNLKYLIKLFYKRQIPRYATELMACGKQAGDWMFGGADYRILNNAIPAEQYRFNSALRQTAREELGLEDALVIGLTARFSPPKNHRFLLEVFAEVAKTRPDARLLLVGDGELRPQMEETIRKLGLGGQVVMTGVRTDVSRLLQAMDVFVMPSRYEGLSLAIVEAQAAGLPCLISDGVSGECILTDLVQQLPLSDGAQRWANAIQDCLQRERRDRKAEIEAAGFDIESAAAWLQDYYLGKAQPY